jgi:glycine/D-amino acid oxidase-like deaminating enzyme
LAEAVGLPDGEGAEMGLSRDVRGRLACCNGHGAGRAMAAKGAQPADVVVVGGGFAGAATAYHLVRSGLDVVLLEQEDLPGRHSSGRNAAVARRLVAEPDHRPLAIEGIRFMESPPDDFPRGRYFERTGSMMLGGPELEETLRASVETGRALGVQGEWLTSGEVERLVPATAGGTFCGAAYSHDDGVADIAALLDAFLRAGRAQGLRVLHGCRLTAVTTRGGAVTGVRTTSGDIDTPAVVNAAGAWSTEVARLAGIPSSVPLRSLKRHLMVTAVLPWDCRAWPAVWDLSHQVYFRPEAPGLLLSPCDATESDPPGEASDGTALELLAEKLTQWLPQLAAVSIASTMAGLRTFTPDGNMALGEDPQLRGFFWCAGLGGNGMTLSPALGRIVAESVLGVRPPAAHAAARFAA